MELRSGIWLDIFIYMDGGREVGGNRDMIGASDTRSILPAGVSPSREGQGRDSRNHFEESLDENALSAIGGQAGVNGRTERNLIR